MQYARSRAWCRVGSGFAYVSDYESGLRVINTSNPASPIEVGNLEVACYTRRVALSGNYAYIAVELAVCGS